MCLWGPGGCKVAQVLLEEAVTALSAGPLYAVAGTERGDVHVVVLSGEGGGSSSSEALDGGETEPSKDQVRRVFHRVSRNGRGGGGGGEFLPAPGWCLPLFPPPQPLPSHSPRTPFTHACSRCPPPPPPPPLNLSPLALP